MTKTDALKFSVEEYFTNHKISTVDDIRTISEGVLDVTYEKFDEHNVVCDKDKKWKLPDTLSTSQLALIIRSVFHVKTIRCCKNSNSSNDLLGIYVDDTLVEFLHGKYEDKKGIYVTDEEIFALIAQEFNFEITDREVDDLVSKMKRNSERVYRTTDEDLVPVANGIFNYKTKELLPFSPDIVVLTKSQVSYNPNAQLPMITMPDGLSWNPEIWMNELSDNPEVVNLLWEIIGAVIRPNVRWNKSAWMVSDTGNNGKGTLCEMMRQLCGEETCVSIPLSDFSKNFALEPLIRASAIITDENDVGTYIDKCGNLKAIITRDSLSIDRKFKTPVTFEFYGFMVQCLNESPKIKDKSDSFYRRQLFIPMTKCFTGSERAYIKNDYLHRKDVLEYILYRVLNMNYYKLSEPECCKEALDDYKGYNDPVREFWSEVRDKFVWDMLPKAFLYDLYRAWFERNCPSGTVQNQSTFLKDLIAATRNDDMWYFCKEDKRVPKGAMSEPELLIVEYNLSAPWRGRSTSRDPMKISVPDRLSDHYTNCFIRR
ncbi:MAG: ATPase [Ruminococcaceae bacterium]|nr:ATPase [Oscillospiraceae bacterium]